MKTTTTSTQQASPVTTEQPKPADTKTHYKPGLKISRYHPSQQQMINTGKPASITLERRSRPVSTQQEERIITHFQHAEYKHSHPIQAERRSSRLQHTSTGRKPQLTYLEDISEQKNRATQLMTYLVNRLDANQDSKTSESLQWIAKDKGTFRLKLNHESFGPLNQECLAYGLILNTPSENLFTALKNLLNSPYILSSDHNAIIQKQLDKCALQLKMGEPDYNAEFELNFNTNNRKVYSSINGMAAVSTSETEPSPQKKARLAHESDSD